MAIPYRPRALTFRQCCQKVLRGINPNFSGLFPCKGQVPYALRTRAPVAGGPKSPLPLDLHVLGLPLAFILSQDQTLHRCALNIFAHSAEEALPAPSLSIKSSAPPAYAGRATLLYGSFRKPLGPRSFYCLHSMSMNFKTYAPSV